MRIAILAAVVAIAVSSPAIAAEPVVAVIDFTNETSAGWWGSGVGRDLADMLTNELDATGAFRVVEREKLDDVLREQDLQGRGAAGEIGRLTGAQFLVTGKVSSWEENTRGGGGGVSFRGISVGGSRNEAYMAIDIRVIDVETGEIVQTRTIEGRSGGFGLRVSGYRHGLGGSLARHDNTPAGKAIRAALIEATDYLACVMVDRDGCEAEYAEKERGRRQRTRSSISLD